MTMENEVQLTPEERVQAVKDALPAAMRDRVEVTFDVRPRRACVIRLRLVQSKRAARESGVDEMP